MPQDRRDAEEREVIVDDPSLSPETNRQLTVELRLAVGKDTTRVPRGTPHPEREPHGGHGTLVTALIADRLLISVSFFVLLVVGVIVSLATGSWWAVVAAVVVHAVATFAVLSTVGGATRNPEHVDPSLAARHKDEGVPAPDRYFSDLVESFAGDDAGGSAADLVTGERNEQQSDPLEDRLTRRLSSARRSRRRARPPARPTRAPARRGRRSPPSPRAREWVVLSIAGIVVAVGAFTVLMGWIAGEL